MKKAEAYWPLLLLLAIIKFVLPIFLQSPVYELHRDEFLYYQQGQHFALGYLENPPVLSWMGMISSWFGGSMAWIKFWPCLTGAATLVLTCLITAQLGGNRFAQFIAGTSIILGSFLRVHFLFQPNGLDIFSWTLVIYFLVRYIQSNKTSDIYGITISIAIGWWCKYSILFMAIALVAGLLLTRQRGIFLKKQTWMAALFALLLIAPNLWWQYQHNWPLFHHMKELQEKQLGYISPFEFLEEQIMMLLPSVIIWIAGLIWLWGNKHFRIIAIIYTTILVLLVMGSGKGYYALGAYPMLLAAGGVVWERITEKRKWIRLVLALLVMGMGYLLFPLLLPTRSPEKLAELYRELGIKNKWEDQKDHALTQDFADMLGWKELSTKTARVFAALPDSVKKNTLVYCGNYGQAGALLYYAGVNTFDHRLISANGSFVLWIPDRLTFNHLLLVTDDAPPDDDELFIHFRSKQVMDSVTYPLSRQMGDKIILYQQIDTTGHAMMMQYINDKKNKFSR